MVPRFGVAQGIRQDGTKKVRAIDNFSWAPKTMKGKRTRKEMKADSINGHYAVPIDIKHDHLDMLHTAMRCHHDHFGKVA